MTHDRGVAPLAVGVVERVLELEPARVLHARVLRDHHRSREVAGLSLFGDGYIARTHSRSGTPSHLRDPDRCIGTADAVEPAARGANSAFDGDDLRNTGIVGPDRWDVGVDREDVKGLQRRRNLPEDAARGVEKVHTIAEATPAPSVVDVDTTREHKRGRVGGFDRVVGRDEHVAVAPLARVRVGGDIRPEQRIVRLVPDLPGSNTW